MANPALVLDRHPLSPIATSPPSLRLRSPPLLGPASREAIRPVDHTDPLHFEMCSTKSALEYNGAALPALIPRARAHLRVHRPLNTVDLELAPTTRSFLQANPICIPPPVPVLVHLHLFTLGPLPLPTCSRSHVLPLTLTHQRRCRHVLLRGATTHGRRTALEIPPLTHDPTLRPTNHPASTCILSSPIHVSIMHPSNTTWAGPRQLELFWIVLRILRSRRIPLPSLLQIHLPRLPINSFSDLTNSHGRSSSKPVRPLPQVRKSSALALALPSRGLSLRIWTYFMRSTLPYLLVSPLRSGKPWATEARRNGRLRGRTKSAARLWEVGKAVSVASTG